MLFRELLMHHYHTYGLLMGGASRHSEQTKLAKGINILIATPGRLLDHLQHTKVCCISNKVYGRVWTFRASSVQLYGKVSNQNWHIQFICIFLVYVQAKKKFIDI